MRPRLGAGTMDSMDTVSANLPNPIELRDMCVELVTDAAEFVAHQRAFLTKHGSVTMVSETKSSEVDPVTAVDSIGAGRGRPNIGSWWKLVTD